MVLEAPITPPLNILTCHQPIYYLNVILTYIKFPRIFTYGLHYVNKLDL